MARVIAAIITALGTASESLRLLHAGQTRGLWRVRIYGIRLRKTRA
jgi:hypothetical protein